MPQEVINILYGALATIVTALIGWGVTTFTMWLNGKMKDKKTAALLTHALEIVADAVKLIFQEFVEALKKSGKFDEAAQKEAKEAALKIIMTKLTPELKEFIAANYGEVVEWVSNQVEIAIYNFKNQAK